MVTCGSITGSVEPLQARVHPGQVCQGTGLASTSQGSREEKLGEKTMDNPLGIYGYLGGGSSCDVVFVTAVFVTQTYLNM